MNDEIKEILDKLKNRNEETLIAGLRECQLKNIEHVFITKEEYIDKVLDYITNLQQELQRKDNIIKFIKQYINDNCWGYAGIDEDGINILLDKIKELEKM